MIGLIITSIQEPSKNNPWFILNTNEKSYELRLGGLKVNTSVSQGDFIDFKFNQPKIIRVLTDNFSIFIELDNGYCIVHSDTYINNEGETSFEIKICESKNYIYNGGIEGMYPITNVY